MNNGARQLVKLVIAVIVAVFTGWIINDFVLSTMNLIFNKFLWLGSVELMVIFICYIICDNIMDDEGAIHIGSIITGMLFVSWTVIFIVTAIASY